MIRLITVFALSPVLSGIAAPDLPTFEELKEQGAQQSSYKTHTRSVRDLTTPEPALEQFRDQVKPILTEHCVDCHGPDKSKANLRVDTLDPNLLQGSDVDWWLEVMAVLGNGEMPPPEKSKLADADRARVVEWLSQEIQMASQVRRATGGHSSFRRMTRYEYNYALQDLLGLERDFARDLPPEARSEDGFKNSSETLQISVNQLETYRTLARNALARATVKGEQPPVLYWGVSMDRAARIEWKRLDRELEEIREEFADDPEELWHEIEEFMERTRQPRSRTYFKDLVSGQTALHEWSYGQARHAVAPSDSLQAIPDTFDQVAIIPPGRSQDLIVELGDKIPDQGIMRVRVLAARTSVDDEHVPSLQLEFGWQASNEGRARLRVSSFDHAIAATPEQPRFYQWDVPLGDIYPRNSVRKTSKLGSMPNPSEYIRLVNSSVSGGEIQISYVEVSTPIYHQWPPESHRRIFFDGESSADQSAHAREIISSFMKRAWRRPVSDDEIDQKLKLFEAARGYTETFEDAVVEVMATVLSSPDFLYLVQGDSLHGSDETSGPTPLTDFELASRLSFFLWCSVPDARLLELAEKGQLSDVHVLMAEVDRMLADKRSERFAKHFVHQWLDMDLLDFLSLKRGFGSLLKEAMQQEPILMFQEMLSNNESVLDFIHADYTMANERLARHYGVPNVLGNHFRRIDLDPNRKRGGLLTQAGLLAMNSSGDDSNPLKRGIWMLESLLNDPPPPPPPAVPEIDLADPRIAQMTLKERIEDHRNHPACMSCHSKIDPWGIAFENYDALGRWRDEINGKPVDASSRLFNNEPLNGMDGLKRFLLKNRQDQFVNAIVHKVVVYALGRPLTFADRAGVEEITAKVRGQGDGLATLVKQVVASELFQSK